jgi:hypothetical protein
MGMIIPGHSELHGEGPVRSTAILCFFTAGVACQRFPAL